MPIRATRQASVARMIIRMINRKVAVTSKGLLELPLCDGYRYQTEVGGKLGKRGLKQGAPIIRRHETLF